MFVADRGHEGVTSLLLARFDVEVNLQDSNGQSALMQAAGHGHEGTTSLLLARSDVEVNLVENKGRSALMIAAGLGHGSAVRVLLNVPHVDAALRTTEESGRTAMELAVARGHTDIVKLLEEFESRRPPTSSSDASVMDRLSVEEAAGEGMDIASGSDTGSDGEKRLYSEYDLHQLD
jgi:ankyrin repeat protein